MKNCFLVLMAALVLLAGCGATKEPEQIQVPTTLPETIAMEPTEISTVPSPSFPEETEPVAETEERIWQSLYWMEGEKQPQLRCMVTNEEDSITTAESVFVQYYLADSLVKEELLGSDYLDRMDWIDRELSYMESTCIWVTVDLPEDAFDRVFCTVNLSNEEGETFAWEFWFVADPAEATHPDPFAGRDTLYATLENNQWGFFYFPMNHTSENLKLEGWYWKTFMNGDPVTAGGFTMANLPPTASGLKILFADEMTVHNNGISALWCNYNQREDVFVWRSEQGESYVQSFRFLLDEEHAGRVIDIKFPEVGELRHAYKVSQENQDSYASVIDFYDIPEEMGKPKFTVSEIREMIESELTLDEVAAKIDNYADLLQYLYIKGYKTSDQGDVDFTVDGIEWSVTHSALVVFDQNYGNCGDSSNLINYILRDDYDEQGYVVEVFNDSGHVYNYFKQDGIYYFADAINIVTTTNTYANADYKIFATEHPVEYASYHVELTNSFGAISDGSEIWMQFLYPWDGSHEPVGWNNDYTEGEGTELPYVYSRNVEEIMKMLYLNDQFGQPVFVNAPAKELWPEGTR